MGQRLPSCIKTEKHEPALAELVTVCSELGSPLSSYFYLFLLFLKIAGLAFSEQEMLSAFEMGPKTQGHLSSSTLTIQYPGTTCAFADTEKRDHLITCLLLFCERFG